MTDREHMIALKALSDSWGEKLDARLSLISPGAQRVELAYQPPKVETHNHVEPTPVHVTPEITARFDLGDSLAGLVQAMIAAVNKMAAQVEAFQARAEESEARLERMFGMLAKALVERPALEFPERPPLCLRVETARDGSKRITQE